MRKKAIKLLRIVLMFVVIFNILGMNYTKCYASPNNKEKTDTMVKEEESVVKEENPLDVTKDPDSWKPSGSTSSTSFDKKVSIIASAVRTVGIIVSVMTLMIIGIKFMLGSVEEKAQYKQTLVPWLIGAILVFAMTSLPAVIYDFTQGTFN